MRRIANWVGVFKRLSLCALLGAASAASAQVAVNQISFPSNIGRGITAEVVIDYTRTSSAPSVVLTPIPAELSVNPPAPPAGCTVLAGPVMSCAVPAGGSGSSGTIRFNVMGAQLGSFSLTATAQPGGSSASNTGTVRSAGDLTVGKTMSPVSPLLAGQNTTFTLAPNVAAGGDDLPAGAVLTVTDNLPGTSTDFNVTAVNAGIASCNSAASANTSRVLTCTYSGPLTAAQINAARITVSGTPGNNGNFTNVASIADGTPNYIDQNTGNNTTNLPYRVDPASDIEALGTFPSTPVLVGSTQNLVLTYSNKGPSNLPAGGTVSTQIPAGFKVNSLPAGCTGPATGVVLAVPTTLTCTAGATANGAVRSFTIPLTMPATAALGDFPVTVTPPSGFGDANTANNTVNVPYQVSGPYADLGVTKGKTPTGGARAPGDPVTTTLTVTNTGTSTSPAVFSAGSGSTPLRVIDYMRPEEIAGDALTNVTAGWTCTVSNATDPTDATRTKRVTCVHDAAGSLAVGASLAVSFQTAVGTVSGQVNLTDRGCTGETLLTELGLTPADGPQPPASGLMGNDCQVRGNGLYATDVAKGQAQVQLLKEASTDGVTWFDDPASPALLAGGGNTLYWRLTVATPSTTANPVQKTIPTLRLADNLPGLMNVTSPGQPAPSYRTPAIAVTTTVVQGAATGSCANLAANDPSFVCVLTDVQPGTTVQVLFNVPRPLVSGLLTNTARVTSPDAILTGTQIDSATADVVPRVDVATTTKTITPATPRVGQPVQFTVTAQNLGPDDVAAAGAFTLVDDLNTSLTNPGVAWTDIAAAGTGLACTVATSALAGEPALASGHVRVRCLSTAAVPRYETRTVTITARALKPGAMGTGINDQAYSGQSNTARSDVTDALCEFKQETTTNADVSTACNDAASTSNNARSVTFNVMVPKIDVQQRKARVLPAGQTSFYIGQNLRYRFRIQNNGPSRAEGVVMTDALSVPAGYTLSSPTVYNVNGVAAEAGYTLDTTKNTSVACSQSAANADMVCRLSNTAADDWLDGGREVNFEVEFVATGNPVAPITVRNEALVCADESLHYESSGSCSRTATNNNNVASVNDTLFPRADLSLSKRTVTALPVSVGQAVAFDLVVQNLGPQGIQQIRVQDVLPAGFEWMGTGAQAPTVTLGAFVTAAPSTATGSSVSCAATPATVTAPGSQQTVSCVIDATPGPLGAGAFPGSADATNTLTLRLYAQPKPGVYSGPYGSDLTNNASVTPGLDGGGTPLAADINSGNNAGQSVVRVTTLSSLSGRVFHDRNGNGSQDGVSAAEDAPIAGVTIVLSGTDALGNPVNATTTTDANGDYLFSGLAAGTYTVTQTQPAGWANSTGTPPAASAGGSYTAAASATTSTWSGITLPASNAATGYLFPESQATSATISGTIYIDRNRDGQLTAADPGRLPGVTLKLVEGSSCTGTEIGTTVTDSQGNYTFPGGSVPANRVLAGGSYSVCETQPAGWGDGATNPGSGNTSPAANHIVIASLPSGGSSGNNFGEQGGQLAGKVYLDAANDGSFNGSDQAIAGNVITLTGGNLPVAGVAATTAADGSYVFYDLPAGSYQLTQQAAQPTVVWAGVSQPTINGITTAGNLGGSASTVVSVPSQISAITLPAGGQGAGYDFAETLTASLSGSIYQDANNDGQRQPTEPGYAGQSVVLTGTNDLGQAVNLTTTTDANGNYAFDGLRPGTYTVTQPAQPAGSSNGQTTAGTSGGTATAVGTVPSAISGIVLGPNQSALANNFGEVPPARIAGSIYGDANNDGQRQPAEPGYAGQTVVLTGTDDLGQAVNLTTTTDANGNYAFDGLRPGTYTVTQPAQPAGSSNGQTTAGTSGGTATAVGTVPSAISGIVLTPGANAQANNFGEIGSAPDVVVTKLAIPTTLTEQNAGQYRLAVRNAGTAPTTGSYTVVDTLPAGMSWQGVPAASAWQCQVSGQTLTCASSTVLAAGAAHPQPIDAAVQVAGGACGGQPQCQIANVVQVSGGGEPASRAPTADELANPPVCVSPATQNVCRWPTPVQQAGGVSGIVWVDTDHDRTAQPGERRVPGFTVELYQNGQLLRTATTDANGQYQFLGLVPGTGYELRFRDPATGAYHGRPVSADPAGGNDPRANGPAGVVPGATLEGFTVPGGNAVRANQSLPLDPSGVVYDSQTRQAVPGARVELLGPNGQPVPPACVLGGVNALTTAAHTDPVLAGSYAFWLISPAPAGCPGAGEYQLRVTPPTGYLNAGTAGQQTSLIIPAQPGALSVPANCVGYVPGGVCAVQSQLTPPTGDQSTAYYWRFPLDPGGTGVDVVANHIPLDPFGGSRFVITKQAGKRMAEIGDPVTYTLTVRHLAGPAIPAVQVEDTLPRGLRYIPGTFRIAGRVQPDPTGTPGPQLTFAVGTLPAAGSITFTYVVRVGAATPQGDAINRAQGVARNGAQEERSNVAQARITIGGGVFSDAACVVGKVYVDCNHNQVQDEEELGIPGVRLVLEDGTGFVTDVEGKYSHCGLTPRTHVLKLDATTLPRGARLVTSSSRNAGDAGSLFLDLKNGELHRADFIEGSCRNPVLEQVKARRAQGEARSVETEPPGGPPLRWRSKPASAPEQATESADQTLVQPRQPNEGGAR